MDENYQIGEGGLKCYNRVLPKMIELDQCKENEVSKLLFRQLEVVPLTTKQNIPEWFLLQ
jgi:hypothetical protein